MDQAAILKKIKALRAKANNKASTEAEVETAARMVAKLMMQHDVSEDALVDVKKSESVHSAAEKMKLDIEKVMDRCWSAIELLTETKCYKDNDALNFIGTSHDVEMALYLTELVQMSAKRGWLGHVAELFDQKGLKKTKDRRVSYYTGFGDKMHMMLWQLNEERQQARTVETGTALVVAKGELISAKMKEMGLNLKTSPRKREKKPLNSDSYGAGGKDAEKVNLGRPLREGERGYVLK